MIAQEYINDKVNSFDVEQYLHGKGISIFRSSKGYCFKSPFRTDSNPSAIIYFNTKLYQDIGSGQKMNLINFIMRLENCNFDTAFQIVSNHTTHETQYRAPETPTAQAAKYIYQPLQHRNLITYAQKRGVSEPTAKKYLSECWKNGKYYYLAFRNDNGGYALRNDTTGNFKKINDGTGGVTTINHNADKVVIFEGFFDFLSWVEYMTAKGKQAERFNAIVLNSCSNLSKIINKLACYTKIYLLLDNDRTGTETTQKIINRYPDKAENITPRLLNDSHDFNDFWVKHSTNKV